MGFSWIFSIAVLCKVLNEVKLWVFFKDLADTGASCSWKYRFWHSIRRLLRSIDRNNVSFVITLIANVRLCQDLQRYERPEQWNLGDLTKALYTVTLLMSGGKVASEDRGVVEKRVLYWTIINRVSPKWFTPSGLPFFYSVQKVFWQTYSSTYSLQGIPTIHSFFLQSPRLFVSPYITEIANLLYIRNLSF